MSEIAPPPSPSRIVRPRGTAADIFELNPRAVVADELERRAGEMLGDDAGRVREAMRYVIEEGASVSDAAREWGVTQAALLEWRARYLELLQADGSGAAHMPLIDFGDVNPNADLITIPEEARRRFAENWERLLEATRATPEVFRQSPLQVLLQNSRVTSWLFTAGRLDRTVVAGSITAVAGLILTTAFLTARHQPLTQPPVVEAPAPPVPEYVIVERAAETVRKFLSTPVLEERLALTYQPERSRASMEEFLKDHPPTGEVTLTLVEGKITRGIVSLCVDVPEAGGIQYFNVVTLNGRQLVDWPSSSVYQEAHIADLRRRKPTEPARLTVIAGVEKYYNYAFRDPVKWQCFGLGYPRLGLELFGYTERGTPQDLALNSLISLTGLKPVVLEVRFPPDAVADNQVEILRVLEEEWFPEL